VYGGGKRCFACRGLENCCWFRNAAKGKSNLVTLFAKAISTHGGLVPGQEPDAAPLSRRVIRGFLAPWLRSSSLLRSHNLVSLRIGRDLRFNRVCIHGISLTTFVHKHTAGSLPLLTRLICSRSFRVHLLGSYHIPQRSSQTVSALSTQQSMW